MERAACAAPRALRVLRSHAVRLQMARRHGVQSLHCGLISDLISGHTGCVTSDKSPDLCDAQLAQLPHGARALTPQAPGAVTRDAARHPVPPERSKAGLPSPSAGGLAD